MTDESKKAAFQKFSRFDKTGQIGSGLGLSIVETIAQQHGASLSLHDNHPTGLKISVKWNDFKV